MRQATTDPITLRYAKEADRERIAELAVADPFRPTADVVEHGRGPVVGRLMLIRQRAGAIA